MMTEVRPPHVPVLRDRIVGLLTDAVDGTYLDGTLGAAGHAVAVLAARAERHGHADLVGIDRDPHAHDLATAKLAELGPEVSIALHQVRFDALGEVLDDHLAGRATASDGPPALLGAALLDLGISSMHVDEAERGFSYRQDGPLDMRMGPDAETTAAELVNTLDERELTTLLTRGGEDRHARRIARGIVAHRPYSSTVPLAEVVRDSVPAAARRKGGHPATRTFQALRIAVNGELEALENALPQLLDRLAVGGVLAVLAYHSLEDRIVKRAFVAATTAEQPPIGLPVKAADLPQPDFELVVRGAERPDDDELAANPRSQSARLRVVRRVRNTPARS